MMKRTGVSTLSLKDFHLPYDSTQEQIKTVLQKLKMPGSAYIPGVIYMKTPESVDQAFEYAKWPV